MSLIACPSCGTENDAERKFCVQCGTRLASGCPACGTVNPPGARFCGNCGTNLAAPAAASPILAGGAGSAGRAGVAGSAAASAGGGPAPLLLDPASPLAGRFGGAPPIAERRLVSVLFVDLVGFTTASEGRDAEDTRDLLTRYYDVARGIVGRYGGTIEKFIGDAVMGVWGTPSAHEDDAERAVRAALELVAAVPRLEGAGEHLQARAGVLTGEAAVAIGLEGQGMIAGDLVNTASRLQSVARPGTVLVGEATYRAASRAISFESAGEKELKGKEQAVATWEAVSVVGRRGGEGRAAMLEPPFVGRDDELELLKDLFHATAREGKPRLVTLSGVAGIGKSRVLWEFEKYLDGVVENVWWHAGRSPSYGEGLSYRALAEMLRSRAAINDADDPAAAREKVRAVVQQHVPDEADRRWIEARLLGLLGLEALPEESRDELFAAWRTLFERLAATSPVVLGFWDIQWADQGTLDFIEHLLGWARSSPILVLAEARPELFDRRPDWGRSQRSATLMHLAPLAEDDMRRLLGGLVPELPEDAARRIIGRAEGVPLYAVETLRMLQGRGVLVPQGSHFTLSGDLPELAVPETLHALIAARLDALPPAERSLLTDGAVLGLSFTLPSLVAVAGLAEEAVQPLVDGLARRELLILDADPRSPERGQYRFLQGVVREIAYQSLGKKNRQARHLAAARHFETQGEGGEDLAAVRASHYLTAFQASPAGPEADAIAAQARVALRAAADRATALHDLAGALASLEQALLVTLDPLERAAIHERAIVVAGQVARFARAHEHAEDAVATYEERGDRLGVIRTRARESAVHLMEHHDQTSVAQLRGLITDAEDLGATAEIAQAQAELARALMLSGQTDESIAWADRVLAHPEVAARSDLLEALISKGTALTNAGRDVEAEALLRGAIPLADAQGNLAAGLRARNNLRVLRQQSDLREALALTQEVGDMARKFGQRSWVLHGSASKRDVSFRLGDWDRLDDPLESDGLDSEDIDPNEFYGAWFQMEILRRELYRNDPAAAEAALKRYLENPAIAASAQAITWNLAAIADAQSAQGRFEEAIETARGGWSRSAENEMALIAGLFAASALGETTAIAEVRDAWRATGLERVPAGRAFLAMADALEAVIEGRFEDARARHHDAERLLEQVGEFLSLARYRLALGQLAGPWLAEAGTAGTHAEAWFAERGASRYVEAFRSRAVRLPARPTNDRPPTAADGANPAAGTADPAAGLADPAADPAGETVESAAAVRAGG